MRNPETSDSIQPLLDRWQARDEAARGELIGRACDRLRRLAHVMLNDYPRLRRWEDTDDILQSAVVRLMRALESVRPESARDFFRLAALQVRRQLVDLARHYYGAEGMGRHLDSQRAVPDGSVGTPMAHQQPQMLDSTWEPHKLAQWTQFHESVEQLAEELVEVFDLVWYQGLSLVEVARLLDVSERTAQRRWQLVRVELGERLRDGLPEV